ncbi:MAG: IS66 family insertion sequence element accessory protein TnpB, partial [Planctomycetota bacterium]|nr:IS66 family insertion sequence element accessory protein TnpB [Planctomycetota bacterium]
MRKGFDGLSGVVIDVVDEDPQSGHLFVFFNKRRNLMKAIVWDGSGYWVLYKRLEQGRFQVFDRVSEAEGRWHVPQLS